MLCFFIQTTKTVILGTEDPDQTARIRRLICFCFGYTCEKVRFLTLRHMIDTYFSAYTLGKLTEVSHTLSKQRPL